MPFFFESPSSVSHHGTRGKGFCGPRWRNKYLHGPVQFMEGESSVAISGVARIAALSIPANEINRSEIITFEFARNLRARKERRKETRDELAPFIPKAFPRKVGASLARARASLFAGKSREPRPR